MTTASGDHHRARLLAELGLGLAPALAAGGATAWMFGLPASYLLRLVGLYAVLATLIYRHHPDDARRPGLGPANRVTLVRAGLVLAVAALVPAREVATASGAWWVIGVSTVALLLDGVDGRVARRTGSATPFGARFDMELDSLLMLVLSLVVWQHGRLGAWVVLLGAPRYLFVAAGWVWPWLAAPLPERARRKAGCVMQGVALLVGLGPIIPVSLAAAAAGTALTLLVSSFLVDVVWLFRHARPGRARR